MQHPVHKSASRHDIPLPFQTRNKQLEVRIEGLGAQIEGLKHQLAGRDGQLEEAKAAMMERDGALRRWEQQVSRVASVLRC